ncbi:MAG: Hpt domain-containing protein [Bdellovibrionales bacterium]|nr:Hpt domain-containing protein [Bdellovibrionales bacterium]
MNINEIMEKLKVEYLDTFHFKVSEIRNKIREKKQAEVIEIFHQIKGSGKTYGFSVFSEIAEKAEYEIPKASQWYAAATEYTNKLEEAYKAIIAQ